ncbi:MAG: phospho-N-acetylmuramoyl-pentapeptide-transferase [Lachnospiraceae bacterium]|nr:phospho-N-acetylmuramoyl-pentapeptide-transferase [Lachnospiraceae bacterium]
MQYETLMPVVITFGVSVVLCPIVIPFLKKLKFGQFVREEGPETHLKKSGTPTMGGLIILASVILVSVFYMQSYPGIVPILFVTLGFGLIGFMDDYIKVVMKRSLGLRAWQKMLGQMVVTLVFAYYMTRYQEDLTMLIPFSGGKYLDLGQWYIPALFFIVLGTVNGANFTDGLDGLASSVTMLIATYFTVAAIALHSGIEPVTCAVVGALLGFLVYNVYPARVFMGDTGSLALGGFVAATAFILKLPLFIPIVAFIYLIEVTSVIVQVVYFKMTGRRILKMAPLHHHFELSGWPETKVVSIFSIITAILCLIGLLAI